MNKKQKICLIVGLAILDLMLISALITLRQYFGYILLIAISFVIINTGVVFVLLKDDRRP